MTNLIRVSHGFFLILLLFATIFYVERVAFIDSSYHLFKMINAESLTFEAQRYGAIFTKWPALMMIKLQVSLKAVMLTFSTWFVIWYYVIFLLVTYVLKKPLIGMAIALSLVTGFGNTFYHSVTETHQAIVYCLLFFAVISSERIRNGIRISIAIMIAIISFLTHPISALILVFLVGNHLVQNKNYKNYSNYIYFIIFMLIASVKMIMTDDHSYEGQFFNFKEIQNSFTDRISGIAFYTKNLLPLYLTTTLMFGALTFNLAIKKDLKNIYRVVSTILLMILLLLFYKGGAHVMKERAFLPFCSLVVLYFCESFLTNEQSKFNIKLASYSSLGLIGLATILSFGFYHYNRTTEYSLQTSQQSRKLIVPAKKLNPNNNVITWSIPYETLLITSLEGPENACTTFPLLNENQLNEIDINENKLFLGAPFYLKHNASKFNKNYFVIDNSSYTRLSE